MRGVRAMIAVGLWGGVLLAPGQAEPLDRLTQAYAERVQPVLARYCVDCHSEFDAAGGVNFEALATPHSVLSAGRLWDRVADTQRAARMPPEGSEAPTAAERQVILDWLADYNATLDGLEPSDPGPPVLRRLTRAEYTHTLAELLGIEFDASARVGLPEDQRVGPFTNNANALDLSDALLDKYVTATEEALSQAIAVRYPTRRFAAHELKARLHGSMPAADTRRPPRYPDPPPATEVDEDRHLLRVEGELIVPVVIEQPGLYRVRMQASGHGGRDGTPTIAIKIDQRLDKSIPMPNGSQTPREYERAVHLTAGEHELGVGLLTELHHPQDRQEERRYRWLAFEWIEVEGPVPSAERIEVDPEVHQRIVFVEPDEQHSAEEAASRVLERFASRAFRRPVSEAELARYLGIFRMAQQQGAGYEASIQWALKAVLLSPRFLFRVEQDRGQPGAYPVSDFELATRLSYFLWSTMPDEELLAEAEAGRLHDPKVLAQQTRRMLADERSQALIDHFFAPWIGLDHLQMALPTEDNFPQFTQDVRNSMARETELFLRHIIDQDRPVLDLIDSDYTFVNRSLSLFYRFGGIYDAKLGHQRVEVKDPRRGGLLGQGSVLVLTSHVGRTSPTMRGKWILDVLLGQPPPPPPPDAGELNDDDPSVDLGELSFRERLDLHAQAASCAGCHTKMDPLGFALDQFDPVGRWRDDINGQAIDSRGVLPDGREASGPADVKRYLLDNKDRVVRNLSEQMLTYALGRELDYYDRPTIARIQRQLEGDDYRFTTLVVGIVTSHPFTHRLDSHPDDPAGEASDP